MRWRSSWVPSLLVAATLAGCMNLTFSQMIQDPGPHDSTITVIALGGLGDLALAATGAGAHASSDDARSFPELLPFYALPLLAVDLLVAVIRIDKYKH